MRHKIKIGMIQTNMDAERAWCDSLDDSYPPKISKAEEEKAWYEIKTGFHAFCRHSLKPSIILLPELSVPKGRLHNLISMSKKSGILVIAGLDYRYEHKGSQIYNEGVIIIPDSFYTGDDFSRKVTCHYFGKTYPARRESELINEHQCRFIPHPEIWLLKTKLFGKFGISICYDFMDLERAALYRGRIQHLLVIAYNQDTEFFKNLAISLSRTVFCNVLICNTGHFGGSIAVSPYHQHFKRIQFLQEGSNIFSTQVMELPVKELFDVQSNVIPANDALTKSSRPVFKERPPGFELIDG